MIMNTLTIQKTINKGYGLSQDDEGKIILVAEALPGEKVDVCITEQKKSYTLARIKDIITPHQDRITPPCHYVNDCGGCNLQHASVELQCVLKTEIVKEALARSGHTLLQDATDKVLPCLASPKPFLYRQRIRLHIDQHLRLGFKKTKSEDIVPIKKCLLAVPEINTCLETLAENRCCRDLLSFASHLEILFNPETLKTTLIFFLTRKPRPRDIAYAKKLCSQTEIVERIFFQGEDFPLSQPISTTGPRDNFLSQEYQAPFSPTPLKFYWEVGGFYQVNLEQNFQMIQVALRFAEVQPEDRVLDLFCGMGNFSIPFAHLAKSLTGFEGQASAIRSANKNAAANNLTNCTFIKKPVHQACAELMASGAKFDCIILDPPRGGAPDLASTLTELTDKKIIYISCDPATLSRDLAQLTQHGFLIDIIQPIDMFPQTHHIETIVLLKKCL